MQIRNNVRERRRERIEQLIGQNAREEAKRSERVIEAAPGPTSLNSNPENLKAETTRSGSSKPHPYGEEPDPELWWKEREKRLKSGESGWHGLKGIPPASTGRIDNPTRNFDLNQLIRGFMIRLAFSGLLFAAVWGWFKLEMPGSADARNWMVSSVTRDMDFQAIEAWYGETFRGSPSFFPFTQDGTDTKEVSALLNPEQTAAPIQGNLVQSFAQNGTGVKIAASVGSDVLAIFTGRVQQVTKDQNGGVTILVQHQNRILTVYGNLEKSVVKPNDWVETGQQLGQLATSGGDEGVLYFAVQQNGKTLDPADVVSID